jgi:hypothetical protein
MLNQEAQKILDSYDLEEQKKWKANPFLTFILRSYENQLIANLTKGGPRISSLVQSKEKVVKEEPKEEPKEDSDEDGMFGLFD